ncbi:hypothetical protein LAZ67_7000632 [Cordylochernes scorpioides]|uniref:Uncharacterized protein n=1 Tax=Cordylochernes scorpioides TaxID=51811 RepID=A0ABY6KM73_9ARAC|nr:hypothetical protein LAZ67_7000632 [Cordylochernes scorpioides]
MTEDSNMQRIAEAGNEYFADALTNMQPHCEDLVSRLTDAIRGIAVPRVEKALISPFDGSYAASNFIQQLERTSEGPQDDATLQTRLRTLLKVIVAVYACGVDVEKGPIRQQLWNAPPCDNVESWFGAQSRMVPGHLYFVFRAL